ncbi:hypothetical protein SO802_029517 [Lithocarpus litseifolius]|uniref:Uncharacterized protein n=1 Tax=Lithocarpus litseifolius TaxID=425828 RepID=A0AAW2BV00_9ROSI
MVVGLEHAILIWSCNEEIGVRLDVKTLSVAIHFLRTKSPEQWAAVDLDTHYSEIKDALSSSRVLLFMNILKNVLDLTQEEQSYIKHDIIAQIYYARRLAEKLHPVARMIELHGGHLVSHERTEEVNQEILELIKASEVSINPNEWTNLPKKKSG